MKIRDLSIGSARVKVEGKIINKSEPKKVRLWNGQDASVADALLEDGSGSIVLSLWGEQRFINVIHRENAVYKRFYSPLRNHV